MLLEIFCVGEHNFLFEAHQKKYSNNKNQIKEIKIFKNKTGKNLNLIL